MLQIEFARGEPALQRLRQEWEALYDALPRRYHAQSHACVVQQLRCLESDAQAVQIAVVRDRGIAVAMVPMHESPIRTGPFAIRRWSLLWSPHATLCPLLVAPSVRTQDLLEQLVMALAAGSSGCDQLLLPSMLDGEAWAGVRGWAGTRLILAEPSRPSMRFDTTSPDSALASASSHFRQNLARQRRKLAALGRMELEISVGAEAQGAAFEAFLEVESSGWKGENGTASAIRLHPRLRDFYAGLIEALQGRQQVWIVVLRLDGRAVAANYCIRTDDTVAVLKIGYDESLRQVAPGNVLLAMLLEACEQDPSICSVSLVTGPAWAERWRPNEVDVHRLMVFAPTLRGRTLHALTRARRALRKWRQQRDARRVRAPQTV